MPGLGVDSSTRRLLVQTRDVRLPQPVAVAAALPLRVAFAPSAPLGHRPRLRGRLGGSAGSDIHAPDLAGVSLPLRLVRSPKDEAEAIASAALTSSIAPVRLTTPSDTPAADTGGKQGFGALLDPGLRRREARSLRGGSRTPLCRSSPMPSNGGCWDAPGLADAGRAGFRRRAGPVLIEARDAEVLVESRRPLRPRRGRGAHDRGSAEAGHAVGSRRYRAEGGTTSGEPVGAAGRRG
jgi:hypothetical protein